MVLYITDAVSILSSFTLCTNLLGFHFWDGLVILHTQSSVLIQKIIVLVAKYLS